MQKRMKLFLTITMSFVLIYVLIYVIILFHGVPIVNSIIINQNEFDGVELIFPSFNKIEGIDIGFIVKNGYCFEKSPLQVLHFKAGEKEKDFSLCIEKKYLLHQNVTSYGCDMYFIDPNHISCVFKRIKAEFPNEKIILSFDGLSSIDKVVVHIFTRSSNRNLFNELFQITKK